MNNLSRGDGPFVGRVAGEVTLTMTPHRARVLATAIWLADRKHWLDQLADDLSTAADQPDSAAVDNPQGENADGRFLTPGRRQMAVVDTAVADGQTQRAGDRHSEELLEALARDVELEIQVARRLETAASQAALLAFEAVTASAERIAHAAEAASDIRAVATARSAAAIAETVKQTAMAVRVRADEEADRVADAASDLASTIALSPSTVHDIDAAARATMVAAAVSAAAVAMAQDVALHATVVARAAADAAMEAAAVAADAAMALELTVRSTAVDVQTAAALTARRVAGETEKAADAVLDSR